jgi:ankyrin repeat protein
LFNLGHNFLSAIKSGDTSKVNSILSTASEIELDCYLNFTDQKGNNAILIAIELGNIDLLDYLIEKGFDSNHQNFEGQSPLHICAGIDTDQKKVEKIISLLKTDRYLQDKQGYIVFKLGFTALHLCVKLNSKSTKFLISVDNINTRSIAGESALHIATTKELIDILLASNANVLLKSFAGYSPLIHHCNRKNIEAATSILTYYIDNKISLDTDLDYRGGTFLHSAVAKNLYPVIELFQEALNKDSTLASILKTSTIKKNTPLHAAAFLSDMNIVKLLISMGCTNIPKNSNGYTASECAKEESIRHYIEEASLFDYQCAAEFVARVSRCVLINGQLLFVILSGKSIDDISSVRRCLDDFGLLRCELINEHPYLCL